MGGSAGDYEAAGGRAGLGALDRGDRRFLGSSTIALTSALTATQGERSNASLRSPRSGGDEAVCLGSAGARAVGGGGTGRSGSSAKRPLAGRAQTELPESVQPGDHAAVYAERRVVCEWSPAESLAEDL